MPSRVVIAWTVAVLVGAQQNQAQGQQSDKTGSLTVTVTDKEINLPVISCVAALTPANAGSSVRCISDELGIARFARIAPGPYRLKVSLTGYFPEIIDSLMIHADSATTLSLRLHPYNGVTEYDAYDDLANGVVRIYRSEWLLGPGTTVSSKYGFRIELKCCDPTFKFDRYNDVIYSYLDSLNGPGWYDKYLKDLWLAKVASDSINRRSKR